MDEINDLLIVILNLIAKQIFSTIYLSKRILLSKFAIDKTSKDMNILELSQQRFSARKYTAEPVSQADLDYILECVRLAPSAVNKQPWKFVVVRSKEAKSKLCQAYDREWFRSAPLYIVCMKNNKECWTRRYDDKPHGDIDVAIAIEHLCLAATERGLGTCWVCNYNTKIMSELLPSDDFEAVAIIPIGHIAEDCPRAEKKRKAIEEIVEEI